MDDARAQMLELTGTDLGDLDVGDEGEDHVGRISLFEMGLDADGICGVDEDTGVLRSDHGFDDRGQVVDIRKRLHAEDDIVVGVFTRGSVFGCANDCKAGLVQDEFSASGEQGLRTVTGLETLIAECF